MGFALYSHVRQKLLSAVLFLQGRHKIGICRNESRGDFSIHELLVVQHIEQERLVCSYSPDSELAQCAFELGRSFLPIACLCGNLDQ